MYSNKMSNIRAASIFQLRRMPRNMRSAIAYTLGPQLGWSPSKILKGLSDRGFQFLPSKSAISLFCKRYRLSGSIADRVRSGRKPRWQKYISDAVDLWISKNREITIKDIKCKLLNTFGSSFSNERIRQKVFKLGWRKKQTRYCQMVRNANKLKRLVHALMCVATKEEFNDVLFTDEASVEVGGSGRMVFRRHDEAAIFAKIAKPKHPFKVHVWGGISRRGATNICVFTGILNSTGYQAILRDNLLNFAKEVFPEGLRFMQDNDPKHTSKRTKEFLTENNIHHWRTPPESPDMNPIEMMWAQLKWYLGKNVKPKNEEELVNGIKEFWSTVTPEMCNNYIDHLKKVIPQVILRKGAASGF